MKRTHLLVISLVALALLSSCQKGNDTKIIGKEALQVMMPTGKDVIHPVHGKEEWFAVGAMNGDQTKANGVAQSHVFADSASIVTVNLNIQPAPKGSHYVAWVQQDGAKERVRLDILQNPLKDVRHVITSDIAKDLRTYTNVVVTLEKDTGPSDTDPVEARGTLIVRNR